MDFAYGDGTIVSGFGFEYDKALDGSYKIYTFTEVTAGGLTKRTEIGGKIQTWVYDLAVGLVVAAVFAFIYGGEIVAGIGAAGVAIYEFIMFVITQLAPGTCSALGG